MPFYIDPKKLREMRKKSGKTMDDITFETGLSNGTISNLETKLTDIRLSTVKKLTKCYGLSPDFWFDDVNAHTGSGDAHARVRD